MYDYLDRRLRLIARLPWVTPEQVLDECEWKPLVANPVALLDPPTEAEISILRTELDVRGQTTDAAGVWVTWDGDRYVREV